jgi:26S proteasome regulatory subunit N8
VGFYSSGPRIRENDLKINALFRQFCAPHEPVFVIIDVRPGVRGSPTTAYIAEEEVQGEGREVRRVFRHTQCSIEAEEAEEVRRNELTNERTRKTAEFPQI